MALVLFGTLFCLLVTGITLATEVPAGSDCPASSSGNTCAATTVCDKVHGKCLLKAEQTCTAGTENCVSGASCVSGVCTCGAAYAKQADKTCKPTTDGTVGFVCTSTGKECTTPNSECSALDACKCKTGFVPNIENGKCDGNVGTTCTAADTCVPSSVCDTVTAKCLIKQEVSCVGNTDKCVSNAACVSNVCKCDDTKADPSTTGLCTLKSKASNSASLSFWLLLVALMSIFLVDYGM